MGRGQRERHRDGASETGRVARSRQLTNGQFDPSRIERSTVSWAAPDGPTLVGVGNAETIVGTGPDRLEQVRTNATRAFRSIDYTGPSVARPRAIGGLAFRDDGTGEAPWEGFPPAWFAIPSILITQRDEETWLTAIEDSVPAAESRLDEWEDRFNTSPAEPRTVPPRSRTVDDRRDWLQRVQEALESIETGPLEKVVVAGRRTATFDAAIDPDVLAARLASAYPGCYRFLAAPSSDRAFVGAPPERLLKLSGRTLETEALAGSAPRGRTEADDARHRTHLCEREVEGREHGLVVDAIVDRLGDHAVSIGERHVRRLATVQHLRTPITATLEEGAHVLELVEVLHPTPAVGGVPRDSALEMIDALESFDRGWYAAPVGWFDAAGDGEFAVGIRSGLVDGQDLHLFAGNGIVTGSEPTAEWDELELKFEAVLEVLE